MTVHKRYVGSASDMSTLIEADALSRSKDTLSIYTIVLEVNGQYVAVKKVRDLKTVMILPDRHDFQFIPVGNRIPVDSTTVDALLDYRTGVSKTVATEANSTTGIAVGDLMPASDKPVIIHGTIVNDEMVYKNKSVHAGTSSWFGDTPHVISWNGIGTMDGCGNDYRAYRQLPLTQAYINPTYEPTYFHANDRGQPPDGTHLKGDSPYIRENPDNAPAAVIDKNTSVFRDGAFVYKATWPVLAACEVKVTEDGVDKYYLRVLCGRWFAPPEKYNPVQGDADYFFEAYSLSGFYLYVQSATGWEVKIIEVPALTEHPTYPTTSLIAQAPHFSPDGSVAVGIIETGYGGTPTLGLTYYEGKEVTKTQAWVFRIDVAAGTCTLVEPASTYTFTASVTNTADSTNYSYTRSQTLVVYPDTATTLKKIVKTEVISTTKDVSDDDKANAATVPVVKTKESGSVQVENIQQLILDRIGELQAEWAVQHPGVPTTGVLGDAVYPTSDNLETGAPGAYSYIPEPADGTGLIQFDLTSGSITSDTSAIAAAWELTAYGPSNIGICGKSSMTNPNQTTTVTKSVTIDAFGTEISTTPATEITSTGGQEIVMRGNGWVESAFGVRADHLVQIPIQLERSWQTDTVSSSSSGSLDVEQLVVVAADARKGAAIIKNMTTGELSYIGITEPSGGF